MPLSSPVPPRQPPPTVTMPVGEQSPGGSVLPARGTGRPVRGSPMAETRWGHTEPVRALGGIHAVRADGGLVHIRPAVPADVQALQELHRGASERSLYLRFFGAGRNASKKYAERLVRPASADHQAL